MGKVEQESDNGGEEEPNPLEYLEQSYFELVFDDQQWKRVNLDELKETNKHREENEEINKEIKKLKKQGGAQNKIMELYRDKEEKKRDFDKKQQNRRRKIEQKIRKNPTEKVLEQLDRLRVSLQRFVNPPNSNHKRKVYVGITSGPDIDCAMKRRNDPYKREQGTTRIICVSIIRRKPTSAKAPEKVLDTIREVNKMYEEELIIVGEEAATGSSKGKMFNRGKGKEGKPSGQDQHILYFAVAE